MEMGEIDRMIGGVAGKILAAFFKNIVLAIILFSVIWVVLFVSVLSLRPVYEASALLIMGNAVDQTSSQASNRVPEASASLTRIAESDDVIRRAAMTVGQNFVDSYDAGSRMSTSEKLRNIIFGVPIPQKAIESVVDRALPRIARQMSVRSEPNSNIIRLSFRAADPSTAAIFVNALSQAFIDRQIELFGRPGAAEFFSKQRQKFENEYRSLYKELNQFSKGTVIYDVEEQKKLLLKRLNDLTLSKAITSGELSQKQGEQQALAGQLRQLAPVTRSTYVTSLVESLSGSDRPVTGSARLPGAQALEERSADPPLLLVKVYQDAMVQLFKVNSELAGSTKRESSQSAEIESVVKELNALSSNGIRFNVLQRAVNEAAANSDLYSRRMVEEQISAELNTAKISPLRILQSASAPLNPVFPNYILALIGCGLISAFVTVGLIVLANGGLRSRA